MPFPGLWGRFNRILMVKKQRFSMWFLQWVSLANTVLPTEIIICRFADEWGGVPPPHTPPVAPPLYITHNNIPNHSSPKMRVEIFTLARGARAHIESTQFIIMTLLS